MSEPVSRFARMVSPIRRARHPGLATPATPRTGVAPGGSSAAALRFRHRAWDEQPCSAEMIVAGGYSRSSMAAGSSRPAGWHRADRLQRRPALPGRWPGRSPQPDQRSVRGRTRRQGVLARLRPILPVRHPDHPGHRPRSALHPRRAPDERDRAARPRTVRRHRRLHRPCLRRVLVDMTTRPTPRRARTRTLGPVTRAAPPLPRHRP